MYTKPAKMPTMVAVITQDDSEPEVVPNANPNMALTLFKPFIVPKVPKKKLLQMTLWAKKEDAPAPDPDFIKVAGHKRASSNVRNHKRYTASSKSGGITEKGKATKSKKKPGLAKHTGYLKAKDDCKETLQLAYTLHIQYLKDLVHSK